MKMPLFWFNNPSDRPKNILQKTNHSVNIIFKLEHFDISVYMHIKIVLV